ncbi:hypothetical protein OEZ86_001963 [Tetradesmus obliquus]|nr:hypothetical protein OEZ86_001963 [Tetradesmus obliquus]
MQLRAGAAAPHVLKLLLISSSTCCSTGTRPAVRHQQRHNSSSTPGKPAAAVCYEDDQHPITAASIPSAVWECLHTLRAAGHEVLLVGGAVRDLLLQRGEPKDYDILTSAQLKQVKALFRNARIIGQNFPICQLELPGLKLELSSMHTRPPRAWQPAAAAGGGGSAGVPADVAEHCLGAGAAPGRGRRSSVLPHMQQQQQQQQQSWAAARRANAAARDFTVNALLYDPFQAVLFDYVGEQAFSWSLLLLLPSKAMHTWQPPSTQRA